MNHHLLYVDGEEKQVTILHLTDD